MLLCGLRVYKLKLPVPRLMQDVAEHQLERANFIASSQPCVLPSPYISNISCANKQSTICTLLLIPCRLVSGKQVVPCSSCGLASSNHANQWCGNLQPECKREASLIRVQLAPSMTANPTPPLYGLFVSEPPQLRTWHISGTRDMVPNARLQVRMAVA
jgi:hypothetical protein